jgi:low affinity Fe/Cu permease
MRTIYRHSLAASSLIAATLVAGCGRSEPQADPAAIDATLNRLIAEDEAERNQLVVDARVREEAREREMADNEQNYANTAD